MFYPMTILHLWKSCSKHFFRFQSGVLLHSKTIRPESKLVTMKFDSTQFRAIITPEVKILSELFQKHDYSLRMAGGAVRDLLMNKQPDDVDFATIATPEDMKKMFVAEGVRMIHRKGESHGTVTVRINDRQNFEITTLRVDMQTDGRHAVVEFTTDWELDAGRRDLTINAMFLGFDGILYDYFNGRSDLEKRLVRFVGDPELRIREDYLRILRYFRFYGRIAVMPNNHEAKTLEAILRNSEGLGSISGERIWMEFKKILGGNFVKEIVLQMISLGLSPHIGLPGNPAIQEFIDVCNRCQSLKPHYITRLTALLKSEEEVLALHSRLKFSKYERELALFIVHNRRDKHCDRPLKPYFKLILESKNKMSDTHEWACEVLKYRGDSFLLKQLSEWKIPKFPIGGHLLLDRGLKSGPELNKILSNLKTRWIESNFELTTEDLLKHLGEMEEKD